MYTFRQSLFASPWEPHGRPYLLKHHRLPIAKRSFIFFSNIFNCETSFRTLLASDHYDQDVGGYIKCIVCCVREAVCEPSSLSLKVAWYCDGRESVVVSIPGTRVITSPEQTWDPEDRILSRISRVSLEVSYDCVS